MRKKILPFALLGAVLVGLIVFGISLYRAAPVLDPSMPPELQDSMKKIYGLESPMTSLARDLGIVRYAKSSHKPAPNGAGQAQIPTTVPASQTSRLIIYNVSLSLVVADTETSLIQIEDLVRQAGGYVVSSNIKQYEKGASATISVRVPSELLDQTVAQMRDLALEVENQSKSGQDITDEYVDLESRLRVLQAAEQELLDLYQTRLGNGQVSEILEVYQELLKFRKEIESVMGRIQYLKQSVELAQISIALTPDILAQPPEIGKWHPKGTIRVAFQVLLSSLQVLVDLVIWIFVFIIPWLVIVGAPGYGIWFLIRRYRSKKGPSTDHTRSQETMQADKR